MIITASAVVPAAKSKMSARTVPGSTWLVKPVDCTVQSILHKYMISSLPFGNFNKMVDQSLFMRLSKTVLNRVQKGVRGATTPTAMLPVCFVTGGEVIGFCIVKGVLAMTPTSHWRG